MGFQSQICNWHLAQCKDMPKLPEDGAAVGPGVGHKLPYQGDFAGGLPLGQRRPLREARSQYTKSPPFSLMIHKLKAFSVPLMFLLLSKPEIASQPGLLMKPSPSISLQGKESF